MEPKRNPRPQSPNAQEATWQPRTATIVPASEYQARGLSQEAYGRFRRIFDHVYQIRRKFELHDLDTARLFKRFMDEPNGVGERIQANILGLINRHLGRRAGEVIERGPIDEEFRRVVVWQSPLNLEAYDRLFDQQGITLNDWEAMLSPVMSFKPLQWSDATTEVEQTLAASGLTHRPKLKLKPMNEADFKRLGYVEE